MNICGRNDLFLVFTCFWVEKWTSADVMILKEPVLLLRSEIMVILFITELNLFHFKLRTHPDSVGLLIYQYINKINSSLGLTSRNDCTEILPSQLRFSNHIL